MPSNADTNDRTIRRTPEAVAAYAASDSRALMHVKGDDLLRELAYRMGNEVRDVTREHYEQKVGEVLTSSIAERMQYALFTRGKVKIDD